MGEFCSLLFLIGAANLDTLLLSVSWTLRNRHLTPRSTLVIAVITSFMTALSLWAGRWTAGLLPSGWAQYASAVLMGVIGLREMWNSAVSPVPEETLPQPSQLRDTLTLALLLALNNMGIGIAAGLGGCSPAAAGLVNLIVSLAMLQLGGTLGRYGSGGILSGQRADFLSGVVMALLGAAALFH